MLKLRLLWVLPVLLALSLPACAQATGPGGAVTGSLPEDAVETVPEAAAVQCDIVFELAAGDVCFPHKSHRRKGCDNCHHQYPAVALETPHPEYLTSSWHSCSSCHGSKERPKRYQACVSCHLADPVNIADETPSSKVAMHKSCWKCHEAGTGAEASRGCAECHGNNGL